MAHFAKIDDNNIVTQVVVVNNDNCLDENGIESEAVGTAFCESTFGGTWKQTSYNGNIRKNYAGIGFSYDPELDAFVAPKPFPSWVLDVETATWQAPVAMPGDANLYQWNEETLSWDVF